MSVEVMICCDRSGESFVQATDTDKPFDIEAIADSFMDCLCKVEGRLAQTDKVPIDIPLLVMGRLLELSGYHLDALASSLNGTRTKRQRELARVCVVLAEELSTESNRHDKS